MTSTSVPPVRVAFVGGTGRSGSTVLANVLGQLPGCVSVGELRYVWERGLVENRLCGCGEPFAQCPFWRDVLERAFGDGTVDPARMMALLGPPTKIRALPRLLTGRRPSGLGDLPERTAKLYAAVLEMSGASVVVDSSKLPSYAKLLDTFPGVTVTTVHLVRDPRAAAFSWGRKKEQPDRRTPGFMERRGVVKSSALWMVWNLALELFWSTRRSRYVRTTYEDFVAQPRAVLERVAAAIGVDGPPPELFVGEHDVRLDVSHTVAGNPARLKHGAVTLRLDDEWRRAMSPRDRLLVTVLTAPLMMRYGFLRLRGR